MNVLGFRRVALDPLVNLEFSLASGIHSVLGEQQDGTTELVALAAGLVAPRRGQVLLNERRVFAAPERRRRVGYLGANETLSVGGTVRDYVASALAIRGDERQPEQLLSPAKLDHWLGRRLGELAPLELRAVLLILALSLRDPLLLALYEPQRTALGANALIYEQLQRARARGAIVLCTVARVEDAARLGGATYQLRRGVWAEWQITQQAERGPVNYLLLSSAAREFLEHLARAPEILAVEWASEHRQAVRVSGCNAEQLSRAVVQAALVHRLPLEGLLPELGTGMQKPSTNALGLLPKKAQAPLTSDGEAKPPSQLGSPVANKDTLTTPEGRNS